MTIWTRIRKHLRRHRAPAPITEEEARRHTRVGWALAHINNVTDHQGRPWRDHRRA